jgi:CheY-like chemotaxis protein
MTIPGAGEGKRVLVVDDEPWVAEILARMLEADGHVVDIAENGTVALERVRARHYDLIVCDVRMPDLDGPGFYARIEQEMPELAPRVVFVTGSAMTPAVERFLDQTRAPFLNKPFTVEDVREGTRPVLHGGGPGARTPAG